MIKNIFVSATVLILTLFYGCDTATDHVKQNRDKELVVVMDIDMPGYFVLNGESYGYQYDLLKDYAQDRGMNLRVIVGKTHREAEKLLERGQADLVAGLSTQTLPSMESPSNVPLYTTSYVILTRVKEARTFGTREPFSLPGELRGKRVLISSGFKSSKNYDPLLDSLRGSDTFLSARNAMELIEALSDGRYDYLICEKSEAQLGCALVRNIRQVYDFSERIPVDATFSQQQRGTALREDFSTWLADYRNGKEYAMLNCLYFEKGIVGQLIGEQTGRSDGGISAYDNIIREVSEREGFDWRLLSAIAYSESRFNPYIVSNKGAKGLMQIMPVVARQFNISDSEVMKPEINVMLAAKLLNKIERTLRISPSASYADRMSIILACYNGGIGHVLDARRLAAKYGGNPDSWADVSLFLQRKADPAYNQDEVVQCGTFNGSGQTLAFVNTVMDRYSTYCSTVKR